METPPWEASKRVARHDYGGVVWQSTQNPRSFLDSVIDSVGESPPQSIVGRVVASVVDPSASLSQRRHLRVHLLSGGRRPNRHGHKRRVEGRVLQIMLGRVPPRPSQVWPLIVCLTLDHCGGGVEDRRCAPKILQMNRLRSSLTSIWIRSPV